MAEILTISPTLQEQGLIAYECPSCGYITSVSRRRTAARSDLWFVGQARIALQVVTK